MAEKQAMIESLEPSQARYRGKRRVVLAGRDLRIIPASLTRTGALAV